MAQARRETLAIELSNEPGSLPSFRHAALFLMEFFLVVGSES